jgi:molecular chaperone DnaK
VARVTVDFGIDLGTTNSAVAVLSGTEQTVFKNNENAEFTPSAVWIDPGGRLHVGQTARQQVHRDPGNAFSEFKLSMGRDREYRFERSGRVMRPEGLSAEVLKSLRADIRQRAGEDVQAAVITVPAAFQLPQCQATHEAAQIAGITLSPLLQEPVAAALPYGFQSESDRVFWLVYDLGGGTFDAAVIRVRDGTIEVDHHGGDNELGGKDIDWAIVEQLLIPAVRERHPVTDFRRGNPRWAAAVAKLKQAAEDAKIRNSRDEAVMIDIEFLGQDDAGAPVHFEYELRRQDVERLAEPVILRSINICRKVLAEKRLGRGDIAKVLLVGGPTLMPYLRTRLADPDEGLGITLEFHEDPLTLVARGAAIFAGTQRIPAQTGTGEGQRRDGLFTIAFPDWRFVGSDIEPTVAGLVQAPEGQSLRGLTVELVNSAIRPPVRTGQINLASNGAFMTSIFAERGRANTFVVELRDSTGSVREAATDPESLTYTVGMVTENPPLPHNVGVALANNEVEWFLEKGAALPGRQRRVLRSTVELRPGQDDVIRIPVVEGGSPRADRNRRIGHLVIEGRRVRRAVPAGSDVEVTISINQSRILETSAFVPILDDEFENVVHLGMGSPQARESIAEDVMKEQRRLEDARQQVAQTNDPGARGALDRLEGERIEQDVASALDAAPVSPDAAQKAEQRLLDLKLAIDELEDALEWPALTAAAARLIESAREAIREHGDADDRRRLERRETEIQAAVRVHDAELLRQRMDELRSVVMDVLDRKGLLQVMWFEQLSSEEQLSQMRDRARGEQLVQLGRRAITTGDHEALRAVNRELVSLLPSPPPGPDASTVMR